MEQQRRFDYYYGMEAEQFAFYRIPKFLFTDNYFMKISNDAKILYGLMLDRMGLSVKNQWFDDHNRVYIVFKLAEVMECMNCSKDKGVKILAELDSEKGIGLIERVKQGLGRPTLIYVKNFLNKEAVVGTHDCENAEVQSSEKAKSGGLKNRSPEVGKTEVLKSEKPKSGGLGDENQCLEAGEVQSSEKAKSGGLENRSPEVGKSEVKRSEKPKSVGLKNRSLEVGFSDSNKTEYNNTDFNNINLINQSKDINNIQEIDVMDEMGIYTRLVKQNIDYDSLVGEFVYGRKRIDEIVSLMAETICIECDVVKIGGKDYPYKFVKKRLLAITYLHIAYVLECLEKNQSQVKNIRSYLLTTLFNAPATITNYYESEVRHDMQRMI